MQSFYSVLQACMQRESFKSICFLDITGLQAEYMYIYEEMTFGYMCSGWAINQKFPRKSPLMASCFCVVLLGRKVRDWIEHPYFHFPNAISAWASLRQRMAWSHLKDFFWVSCLTVCRRPANLWCNIATAWSTTQGTLILFKPSTPLQSMMNAKLRRMVRDWIEHPYFHFPIAIRAWACL